MFGGLDFVPINVAVDPPPHSCFNCWQQDHDAHRCSRPKTRVYCANCGRRGEDLSSCPRCSRVHRAFVLKHFGWEKVMEEEMARKYQEELRQEREREERAVREVELRRMEEQAIQQAQQAKERLGLLRGLREARSEVQQLRRKQLRAALQKPSIAPGRTPRALPPAGLGTMHRSGVPAAHCCTVECGSVWTRLGPRKALMITCPVMAEASARRASANATLRQSTELLRRLTARPVETASQPPITGEAQRILQALAALREEDREAVRRRLDAEFPPREGPKGRKSPGEERR